MNISIPTITKCRAHARTVQKLAGHDVTICKRSLTKGRRRVAQRLKDTVALVRSGRGRRYGHP